MLSTRFAVLALAALALPATLHAQRVSADVAILSGPVAGRIIVGEPYRHPTYAHRPAYREVIVVRGHRGAGWYRAHDLRAVRVYYDVDRDCYYDRAWRGGLRAVVVYQGGGRYYRDYDRGDRRNDYVARRHDRHDDRYRDRDDYRDRD